MVCSLKHLKLLYPCLIKFKYLTLIKKILQHSFILSYCVGWIIFFGHLSLDDVTAVNYIIIQPITRIVTKVHGLI